MAGLDRLRELARDMYKKDLWASIHGGMEDKYGITMRDNNTVNCLLLEIADQIEAEQEERITRRVEDREAAEWVRAHGGIEHVKAHWEGRIAISHVEHMAEHQRERRERMQRHIEYVQRLCAERRERITELNRTIAEMRPRLMPEGMEWLVEAWPRFEDDAPLKLGDMALIDGEAYMVEAVQLWIHGRPAIYGDGGSQQLERVERVKRPAPKVLDADGVEIRVGDTVWPKYPSANRNAQVERVEVVGIQAKYGRVDVQTVYATGQSFLEQVDADRLTHRTPVLAADGRPLREGETVWDKGSGDRLIVGAIEDGGSTITCRYADLGDSAIPTHGSWSPCSLTHERPDSWERLEEDAAKAPCKYFAMKSCAGCPADSKDGCKGAKSVAKDLVRRAKKLAEASE